MLEKLTVKTVVFVLTVRAMLEKIETFTIIIENDDSIKKVFEKVFRFEWLDMTSNEMCLFNMLIDDLSIFEIILTFTNSSIHEDFMKNHHWFEDVRVQ